MQAKAGKPILRDKSFLVIRRDNIGDLVCTTPAIRVLRERFPGARLCALVNSYNVAVVRNHPDLDEVFVYTKVKHRRPDQSVLGVLWERLRMIWRLRRERFDYVLIASPQERVVRLARSLRPRQIIRFTDSGGHSDTGVPLAPPRPLHEVENVFRLLAPLEITGTPPPMRIRPDAGELAAARRRVDEKGGRAGPLIGVHLSTRKPTNRWPVAHFIELIRRLHEAYPDARFLLLWAPGDTTNRKHPGDDDTAARIVQSLSGLPVIAYPMGPLEQLIADLALCDTVITSDGGALHIAAALGKPLVCFFGDIDTQRWGPWGVPHVLLQPPTRAAADISVDDAFRGYQKLLDMLSSAPPRPEAGHFTG